MKWYIRDKDAPIGDKEAYVELWYCCEFCDEYYACTRTIEHADSFDTEAEAKETLSRWDSCGWVYAEGYEVVCMEEE